MRICLKKNWHTKQDLVGPKKLKDTTGVRRVRTARAQVLQQPRLCQGGGLPPPAAAEAVLMSSFWLFQGKQTKQRVRIGDQRLV